MHALLNRLLATAVLAAVSTTACLAQPVVVPSVDESCDGDSSNAWPFHIGYFGLRTQRYQQLYAATDFCCLKRPALITEIRFRPDADYGRAFSSTLPDIEIRLSTTTVAPDHLSAVFANNVGSDETIVFDGALSLSSKNNGTAGGPKDFDIVIPLSTPFYYDPAQGNLLMEVRNYGGGSTTFFDAVDTWGDTTSRTYSYFGSVNSNIASYGNTAGLVTQFTTVPTTIDVLVDVKPGSETNPLNLKTNSKSKGKSAAAGGVLPVAVLTTDQFDAATVDVSSALLGDPMLAGVAAPVRAGLEDVDDDGDLDLLLHFNVLELVDAGAVSSSSIALVLTGTNLDSIPICGVDGITIVR